MPAEHFIDIKNAVSLGLYGGLIDLFEACAVEDLKLPSFLSRMRLDIGFGCG